MISIVAAVKTLKKKSVVTANTAGIKGAELIIAAGKNPSAQRNRAAERAGGDIIYFVDDDSITNPASVKKALAIFKKRGKKTAVVGGPALTPKSDTLLQRVFGEALSGIWASGKSGARYRKKGKERLSGEKELILCNMFIRKSVFNKLSGFRENLYPNEENEFLNRMKKKGYDSVYSPDVFVLRSARKDFRGFINQCFSYGSGRARQIKALLTPGDLINAVPSVFLLYLLAAGVFRAGRRFMAPLFVYLNVTAAFSLAGAIRLKSVFSFFIMLVVFPALHVSYGAGFIYGLIKRAGKRKPGKIQIRKIRK